jgi:hypothetical protein
VAKREEVGVELAVPLHPPGRAIWGCSGGNRSLEVLRNGALEATTGVGGDHERRRCIWRQRCSEREREE